MSKIRQLINRIKATSRTCRHERARVDEAVAVARNYRAVSLGMPRLRQQFR